MADKALCLLFLVLLAEVIWPKILIRFAFGKHMVDDHQHTVGNCDYRFLRTQAWLEMVKLGGQVIATHTRQNPGNLCQNRTQVRVAFGWFATAPLASTQMASRTESHP